MTTIIIQRRRGSKRRKTTKHEAATTTTITTTTSTTTLEQQQQQYQQRQQQQQTTTLHTEPFAIYNTSGAHRVSCRYHFCEPDVKALLNIAPGTFAKYLRPLGPAFPSWAKVFIAKFPWPRLFCQDSSRCVQS